MKKSNKQIKQMDKILNEEIARACMILEAKKVFNKEGFDIFMTELRDYESNLVITESNQGELLYEGLFDRLKNMAKGMANKIAPDNIQKIEQLAQALAEADMELDTAKEIGRTPNEIKALEAKRNVLLKQLAQIDPGYAQQAQQAADAENSADKSAADAGGGEGGGDAGSPAEKKKQVDDLFAKADAATTTKRADTALGRIKNAFVGSYVKSSEANEEMWGAAKRFFSGLFQPKKPAMEDDILMAILAKLQGLEGIGQAMPDPEKVEAEIENIPDGEPEEGGEEEGGLNKETPMSIMTRQKDVKPGKGGEKETPLVMSIEKMGISQKSAQQIAKRIGQYLKQRKIAIAESMNRLTVKDTDKIVESIVFNAPKSLLRTLFEEVSEEDMEKIFAARRTKDPKEMKKVYRKMAMKYHPDRGGEAEDMAKINDEIGKSVYEKYEEKEEDEKPEKGSGETPSAEDIEKDIKSKPEKAAIIFVKDLKQAGVKVDNETSTALATQFDKIKREKVPREKISTALAMVVANVESGETSPRDGKIQVAGIANLDPDKDITKQTPPEKVIRNAYKAERKRIRDMSKGKGVIHKIISRFISDNQHLMKKDPALKDIFDDQPKFNQFAKKVKKNIRRMLQRRGYEDSEIGNLLERINVEREMKNAASKVLLEYKQ